MTEPLSLRDALERLEQRALRAERFIGGITPDEWATIDKAREAAALAASPSPSDGTCLVCEGWGAYCDKHKPASGATPATSGSEGADGR